MSLAKITRVRGMGVYLPGDDIDTDQIIPARFLVCVTFDALGPQLFYDARYDRDGSPKAHPLNDARYRDASVLLTGDNFGCGSSREHAPQSLTKAGFKAIIAESFAEIFFGNSTTLGLVCVTLPKADIAQLAGALEADPSLEIEIDVEALQVRAGNLSFACSLNSSTRDALVRGEWDPISQLLDAAPQTADVQAKLPYTHW